MASQQQSRIQFYLERNKIGPLFEEMMTKLISETPDHPIPFLINHLQTKQGSPSKLHRTLSGSAALWAETGPSEAKATRRDFRSYEKPWQMHPKKPKKSKSDLDVCSISPPSPESKSLPRSVEHPSWEWRTCPESRNFDELNHILQESKKLGKALENLSRSIAVSDEHDQDSRTYGLTLLRPRVVGEWVGREEEDADPLASEMLQPPVPRAKIERWEHEENGPTGSLRVELKIRGLKQQQQQQQHKKLLAAMLSQDSFDSGTGAAGSIAEEEIEDEDEAMELLEDLDDLRMEGVTSLATSGSKFTQGRSSYCPEPQAKVTLNICSRCARLQGDTLTDGREDDLQHVPKPEQAVPEMSSIALETAVEQRQEAGSVCQLPRPREPGWDVDLKPARGGSCLAQKGPSLKDSLFSKELQNMEKHLAEVEKDLARLSEGLLPRSPNNPHSSLLLTPLFQSALPTPGQSSRPQSPAGLPLLTPLSTKPTSLATGRTLPSSSPSSRAQTPSGSGGRFRTRSGSLTPSSLMPSLLTPGSPRSPRSPRSRPVTPTGPGGRPLLTPPGLSTTDFLGKGITRRISFSEDEFYQQLQAVRQPWHIPSDTESEGMEAPQRDRGSGAHDAGKRSVFSGL